MRLYLFVEGETERQALPDFLRRWLDEQLEQRVGIGVIRFTGWSDYVGEVKKKVHLILSGKSGTDAIGVVGLLDLYGPTFFPSHLQDAQVRYEWGRQELERIVSHPLFRQNFAVHETEAWLLADPDNFPLPGLRQAVRRYSANPEAVNFDRPPSRLLEDLYRQYRARRYQKALDGSELFRTLSPEVARLRCPSLKRLLDDIIDLAAQAGIRCRTR